MVDAASTDFADLAGRLAAVRVDQIDLIGARGPACALGARRHEHFAPTLTHARTGGLGVVLSTDGFAYRASDSELLSDDIELQPRLRLARREPDWQSSPLAEQRLEFLLARVPHARQDIALTPTAVERASPRAHPTSYS